MNSVKKNRIIDSSFKMLGILFTMIGISILVILIYNIVRVGYSRINWDFLTSLPSRRPEKAGIYTAIMGTFYLMILTIIISGYQRGYKSRSSLFKRSIICFKGFQNGKLFLM